MTTYACLDAHATQISRPRANTNWHLARLCVFLGYPPDFRGYRCLEISTGKILVSRHVTFDESVFPYHSSAGHNPVTHSSSDSDPSPLIFQSPSPTPSPTPSVHSTPQPPSSPPSHQQTDPSPSNHSSQTLPTAPSSIPEPPSIQPSHNNPSHPMTTRSKVGTFKPKVPLNLHTTSVSPLPTSHLTALSDPNWKEAKTKEYKALLNNKTWDLVPRSPGAPIIRCMWLFRHKFNADGSLERHKARLFVNGKSQKEGIDFAETFSVVKPATIRTVLSLATSRSWPIHQLDVKNTFLHGNLQETVYMFQPPGFKDATHPNFVCKLRKSLYGLKQAPRAWYQWFATYLLKCGFRCTVSDTSLFVYNHGKDQAYLLLYVDDIILTASNTTLLRRIIDSLSREFAMSDLGILYHFLGITVTRENGGLFLSQKSYAEDILSRANMSNCKPSATPVDTASKHSAHSGPLLSDGTLYRSLAGALQYLTFTQPDISYAVQQICLFMHAP